mmetsp:Transcript_40515/g.115981  ORF Transcript_40515/g.115981 Transcript_40515/m.115981 type:complete len:91 (-) Transcript_40515:118-390(-)
MFSFTAWHLRHLPYRFELLNNVEAISLWVLNLCMLASGLVVSGSWHLTRAFAGNVVFVVYGVLATNALGLASLFLGAKFLLHDDHEILKS